ncbi:hypothetical protein NT6N_28920 [Oceaniferula spumae]|uniref:Ice-binding protein C-terminal domain-containing protein n=1 Tax=Oceaniferula spumae TaxID=2979115 RepID=A0AAT9FNZ9_9BACT
MKTLSIALIATSTLCLAPAQAALIAQYELNEAAGPTLNDSAGTNTSGTQAGAAHLYNQAAIPAGSYGALTLGPSQFGATAGLSAPNGQWVTGVNNEFGTLQNNFTVMAWINPNAISAGTNQRILSRSGITSQGNNGGLNGGWGFGLFGNEIRITGYSVVDSTSTGANITAGTWQHIAATKSSTDGVSFYVNGNLVDTNAGDTGNWQTSNDGWMLFNAFGGHNFVGLGDEIRVYDTVLNLSEIRAAAVPEPSTSVLFGLGAIAFLLRRRK